MIQVAPAELEATVLLHPSVAEVIVVGVPDHYSGELPRAYVVLKQSKTATATEIEEFVKGSFALKFLRLSGEIELLEDYVISAIVEVYEIDAKKNCRARRIL